MVKFIKLNATDLGKELFVNMDLVRSIEPVTGSGTGSFLNYEGEITSEASDFLRVTETPDEILALIEGG